MKRVHLSWVQNDWGPWVEGYPEASPPSPTMNTNKSTEPRVVAVIHLPRGGQHVLTARDEPLGFRR